MALHLSPVAAPTRHADSRLFPLLALATFGALLLAALTALPAAAHSTLLSATPEDGAELEEVPDAVVLTFNEDITDLGTDIVVTGPDGEDATDGETQIEGPEVSRALAADLTAGEYTITWRAVSADGHPIDGESTFTVQEGAEAGDDADESASEATDDATASESAGATEDDAETGTDGTDGSEGDQADADASDAGDAEADPGASEDDGTSGGQIALFVVIGLAVIGGVTALVVRMRRQQ
ncbi:MAG TPA: copper resistance CopC family protein [Ruania sp.]|nr:copper resistance CopC family protein [Ruania sp.]